MCLSKIIIICWPLLRLVILFRDGKNFFREESISLEIIISFSLQGRVKKTKLQEAFFFHMLMLEDFLHNMWWCFLSLEQPDENANSKPERLRLKHEPTSENTHRTGPETACHSGRMTTALIVPATLQGFAVSPRFISVDAKHVQLLVAELPSVLLKPTRARGLRCVNPGSLPVYTNSINQRKL